jgi:hypothetical protein
MKTSFCVDETQLHEAKRDHAKDYPHQEHWAWRDGYVLVCFKDRQAFYKVVEQAGGFRRLKGKIQASLAKVIAAFA